MSNISKLYISLNILPAPSTRRSKWSSRCIIRTGFCHFLLNSFAIGRSETATGSHEEKKIKNILHPRFIQPHAPHNASFLEDMIRRVSRRWGFGRLEADSRHPTRTLLERVALLKTNGHFMDGRFGTHHIIPHLCLSNAWRSVTRNGMNTTSPAWWMSTEVGIPMPGDQTRPKAESRQEAESEV